MSELKVGEWVVCINVGPMSHTKKLELPPLVLNKDYHIQNSMPCKCGHQLVDVGIRDPSTSFVTCDCGSCYEVINDVRWCSSKRFAPVRGMHETLREAIGILKQKTERV